MLDTTWKFYTNSADAWESMYTDCSAAHSSIDIEQYIFNNDEMGNRFLDLLREKKKAGLTIRILCDAVGSYSFFNSSAAKMLVREGIELRFFNPISPWRIGNFSSWFLRTHRKILVVDGAITHIGGVGIAAYMKNWRDTNVRMTGAVAAEVQADFNQVWIAAPRKKFFKLKPVFNNNETFSFLTNAPRLHHRYVYHDLLENIRTANHYIYLTTPYFVPSMRLFRALKKAARRGVDVRILVPQSSDLHVADIAAGSYFLSALKAGIKIYRYDPKKILHAKTGTIDDAWATVGSANMDSLSLLLNFEGNIKSTDPLFISELKKQFIDDLSVSTTIQRKGWIRRPAFLKFLEFITWPIHGIL